MKHVETCVAIERSANHELLLRSVGNPHDDNEVWLDAERFMRLKDRGEYYWIAFPCGACDPDQRTKPAEVLIPKALLVAWRLTRG